MHFKVTARTILQLGAELISSDAIAFYELIKNAFDAGSPSVLVRVVIRIEPVFLKHLTQELEAALAANENEQKQVFNDAIRKLQGKIDTTSFNYHLFKDKIENADSVPVLLNELQRANFIRFQDTGEGMSLNDLNEIYLTVGTSSRRKIRHLDENSEGREHKKIGERRPILGEKGIGRLSVMRLGEIVRIRSTKENEVHYNVLEIDWSIFAENSDQLLESIEVTPKKIGIKEDKSYSGTTISIYKLNSIWTEQLLIDIAKTQLSKFIDPFSKKNRSFVDLWFNKEPVDITNIRSILLKNAHATCTANLEFKDNIAVLKGEISYDLFRKSKAFSVSGEHLESAAKSTETELANLGPFSVKFYWYNNRIVKAIDGIGKMKDVRALIKEWAGGLMLYRDGFRIFPYGSFEDDWLKLDDTAFSSGGYKVNRRQIVGKVDITSKNNPKLVDQTNREGLRDNIEKQTLVTLLQHIMWNQFKSFLESVEKDRLTNELIDIDEIEERLLSNEHRLVDNLNLLIHRFPEIQQEKKVVDEIRDSLEKSKAIFTDAKLLLESYEKRNDVTLHLASLGLMVDIVAHELNRSTKYALDTINSFELDGLSRRTQNLVSTLQIQLKTIGTRLKVLDPLGPSGRNTKETFNLSSLVQECFTFHENQFDRHNIAVDLQPTNNNNWKIYGVKGMFLQIFENLISNSVYWLKVKARRSSAFRPLITITLLKDENLILFADNGPGIPWDRKDDIFLPFVSTKPPGDGKGLGLYLTKEIVKYHSANIYLKEERDKDYLNTFVLDLNSLK